MQWSNNGFMCLNMSRSYPTTRDVKNVLSLTSLYIPDIINIVNDYMFYSANTERFVRNALFELNDDEDEKNDEDEDEKNDEDEDEKNDEDEDEKNDEDED